MSKHFLLVDDHAIVRSGIRLTIQKNYQDAVIHEAMDGETAFQLVRKNDYDLLVFDLHMPNTDTMTLVMNVLNLRPAAKIIIFTMGSEDVFARRYLKAGVKGFLSKECEADEVATAIQTVLGNRKYLSEKLVNNLTNDKLEKRTDNPFQSLSNRQLEIAMLLIAGKTVSEISDTLNIQNSTVGTHKAHIFEKLQVDNSIDLRELARLYQII